MPSDKLNCGINKVSRDMSSLRHHACSCRDMPNRLLTYELQPRQAIIEDMRLETLS